MATTKKFSKTLILQKKTIVFILLSIKQIIMKLLLFAFVFPLSRAIEMFVISSF